MNIYHTVMLAKRTEIPCRFSDLSHRIGKFSLRKTLAVLPFMLPVLFELTVPHSARADAAIAATPDLRHLVGEVIQPVMSANRIPGMAVGIIAGGQTYVFDFGFASIRPKRPVTKNTLFEIGSISKTFVATLANYAELNGELSLTAMASSYFLQLRGSAFDKVSLLDLGTFTPGGMPLQLPDGINDPAQLMAYYKSWKPAYAPGTVRTYSNPSIALLGLITASRMNANYSTLVQEKLFPALGLKQSFMYVPTDQMANYAQGYESDGTPIRIKLDVLEPEVGGIRTTAGDMLRYLAINMGMIPLDPTWQQAVLATHTGYFQVQAGNMVQDLAWEQFSLPVGLAALQAGNGAQVAYHPNPVTKLNPPLPPRENVLLNKTGSTNGFAAYAAFIPADKVGIVLLANKNYPIPARVAAAHAILLRLGSRGVVESENSVQKPRVIRMPDEQAQLTFVTIR